jgi:hypothetical protein
MTCPHCRAESKCSIVNVATGQTHCRACIGPTFNPHEVYSPSDVAMLREMKISTPGIEVIEKFLRESQREEYRQGIE